MKRDSIKHIESLVALLIKGCKKTATGWRCAGCHQAREKRTVWVAYTNTDCNEGRGHDVPIAVCAAEATALRLARKQYVQGTDARVALPCVQHHAWKRQGRGSRIACWGGLY